MFAETTTTLKPDLAKARVLVAEDNVIAQYKAQLLLERLTAETDIADTGASAIQAVQQKNYDLILMDVQMPEMDGLTATRLIRNIAGHAVPVIAMTAHVQESEISKCIAAGMNDFLAKPIEEEKLIDVLAKYFTIASAKEETAAPQYKHPWLNYTYLYSICNHDHGKVNMIMQQLAVQLSNDIGKLEYIISQTQFQELIKMLHYMKSTLDCFSADTPPVQGWNLLNSLIEKGAPTEFVWSGTREWTIILQQAVHFTLEN